MSALAFLSGMAQGVGEQYAKQGEETRLNKQRQDSLLAESINQRLSTDDSLDLPSYLSLRQQEYKLRGLPNADSAQLLQHEQQLWQAAQKQKSASQPATPGPGDAEMGGFNAPLPTAPGGTSLGAIKQAQLAPVQLAQQGIAAQGITSATNATNAAANANIPNRVHAIGQGLRAGAEEGMDPTTASLASNLYGSSGASLIKAQNTPGYVDGADYQGRSDVNGQPLESGKTYRMTHNGFGQPTGFEPTTVKPTLGPWAQLEDGTYGRTQIGPGGQIIGTLTHDPVGHRLIPNPEQVREATTHQIVFDPDTKTWIDKANTRTSTSGSAGQTQPVVPPSSASITRIPTPGQGQTVAGPTTGGQATPASPLPAAPATLGGTTAPAQKSLINRTTSASEPRAFDPVHNKIDGALKQIAEDSKNEAFVKSGLTPSQNRDLLSRANELGITPNNISNNLRDRATLAEVTIPHVDSIIREIQDLSSSGQLGLLKTRWNKFMTGTIGEDLSLSDEEKAKLLTPGSEQKVKNSFSSLATDMKFLISNTANIHGGQRGASSAPILKSWDAAINAKDAATLVSQLSKVKEWLGGYRGIQTRKLDQLQQGATPATAIPSNSGSAVDRLVDKYK